MEQEKDTSCGSRASSPWNLPWFSWIYKQRLPKFCTQGPRLSSKITQSHPWEVHSSPLRANPSVTLSSPARLARTRSVLTPISCDQLSGHGQAQHKLQATPSLLAGADSPSEHQPHSFSSELGQLGVCEGNATRERWVGTTYHGPSPGPPSPPARPCAIRWCPRAENSRSRTCCRPIPATGRRQPAGSSQAQEPRGQLETKRSVVVINRSFQVCKPEAVSPFQPWTRAQN